MNPPSPARAGYRPAERHRIPGTQLRQVPGVVGDLLVVVARLIGRTQAMHRDVRFQEKHVLDCRSGILFAEARALQKPREEGIVRRLHTLALVA